MRSAGWARNRASERVRAVPQAAGGVSERAAYSRLYWTIVDDPKFVTIYDDDHHFAAWTRMLMIADQAHPASAHLPSNVRRASVTALADAGLIDLQPGHRYRVRGLDAERERRRVAATTRGPFGTRTVTGRSPEGFMSRDLDETRRGETRPNETVRDGMRSVGLVEHGGKR